MIPEKRRAAGLSAIGGFLLFVGILYILGCIAAWNGSSGFTNPLTGVYYSFGGK